MDFQKNGGTFAAGLAVGIAVGALGYSLMSSARHEGPLRLGGYRFIHPLLDDVDNPDLIDVNPDREISALASQFISDGRATHISVYFRDLDNGPWFGVKEGERFTPGSLLKVPIMMAALKQAESTPDFLQRKLPYVLAPIPSSQNIQFPSQMRFGQSYPIETFIKAMIVSSDNHAAYTLLTNIDPKILNDTYTQLRVAVPDPKNPVDWLTVKNYSSFYRVLFNASYLNKAMSEKALQFLSEVQFKDGIVAGVPLGTVVAHKFGEVRKVENGQTQLHDCGIVYYPGNPYILCVMTRGQNFLELTGVIREISRAVYAFTDAELKSHQIRP